MKTKRHLVVGDIHGNLKALEQVLERSNFNPHNDIIIFVGDYVDGHPQSAEVVERIIQIPEESRVCLLGNHDAWCKAWILDGYKEWQWVHQGGQATIESYLQNVEYLVSVRHKEFFKSLRLFYELELNGKFYGFVHGGWLSREGLGLDNAEAYTWDRKLWEHSVSKGTSPYTENRIAKYDRVFLGHTATNYDFPVASQNPPVARLDNQIINVDQGAGWSGWLTICDIETLECWQSDNAIELYGKSGRG